MCRARLTRALQAVTEEYSETKHRREALLALVVDKTSRYFNPGM
jgi:hypothetical protein